MFAAPLRARWEHGASFGRIVSALTARRLERYRPGEQLHELYTSLLEDKKGKPHGLQEGELEAEATVLRKSIHCQKYTEADIFVCSGRRLRYYSDCPNTRAILSNQKPHTLAPHSYSTESSRPIHPGHASPGHPARR